MDSASSVARLTRARIISFLVVFSTILLAAAWFVGATWNHFCKTAAMPVWQIVLWALTLAFPITTVLGRRHSNLCLRLACRISSIWIGVLNYAVFAAGAAWIFSAAAALLSFQAGPKRIAAAFFGGAVAVGVYGLGNAAWLRVTPVTVKLANLPPNWRGRSVALVTDLHLGNVRGAGLTRRVVARLRQLQPEAVLVSGDMFDGSKADLDALLEPWRTFSAAAPVYFVTGNHEEFGARVKYLEAAARARLRVLNNEKVDLDGLQIVGVHDRETHDPQLFRALLRQAGLDKGRASILLAHQPRHLAMAEAEGISLQVSGHTHGGQTWPWTLLAARVHGRFNRGLNRLGRLWVLTSNGVGTWGPPLRVGTKSEIILIRLEPAGGL